MAAKEESDSKLDGKVKVLSNLSVDCCYCDLRDDDKHLAKIALAAGNGVHDRRNLEPREEKHFFHSWGDLFKHFSYTNIMYVESRLELLLERYKPASSYMSSKSQHSGFSVISCGHYIHLECYNKLTIASSITRDMLSHGFHCPKCKTPSNIAIPLNYFRDKRLSYDDEGAVKELIKNPQKRLCRADNSIGTARSHPDCLFEVFLVLPKFMRRRLEELEPSFIYGLSMYVSHVRTNVENELILRCQAKQYNKRDSILQRLDTYRLLFKYLSLSTHNLGLRKFYLYCTGDLKKPQFGPRKSLTPLLLKDTLNLLIQRLLLTRRSFSNELVFLKTATQIRRIDMIQSIILALSYVKPDFLINSHEIVTKQTKSLHELGGLDRAFMVNLFSREDLKPAKNQARKYQQRLCGRNGKRIKEWSKKNPAYKFARDGFDRLIIMVGLGLRRFLLSDTEELANSHFRQCWQRLKISRGEGNPRKQLTLIRKLARMASLEYLRAASLLKEIVHGVPSCDTLWNRNNFSHDLMDAKLMDIQACQLEYRELSKYLKSDLKRGKSFGKKYTQVIKPLLRGEASSMISRLLFDFQEAKYAKIATSLLICRPLFWFQPSLFKLPQNYLDLVDRYRDFICYSCKYRWEFPILCLLCGFVWELGCECQQKQCKRSFVTFFDDPHDTMQHRCTDLQVSIRLDCFEQKIYYDTMLSKNNPVRVYSNEDKAQPPKVKLSDYKWPTYLNQFKYDKLQRKWLTLKLFNQAKLVEPQPEPEEFDQKKLLIDINLLPCYESEPFLWLKPK